jgi:acyl-CoA thioesterase I
MPRLRARWSSLLLLLPLVLGGCGGGESAGGGLEVKALEPQPNGEGSVVGGEARTASEGGVEILFVGTSLTEGLGLDNPAREAWPAEVERLAARAGLPVRVRNGGVSGETSAGALRRIDWILDPVPQVVVVETGANDGLRGLDPEALEANLHEIFRRIQARAPEARLVLAGMEAPPNLGPAYTEAFRAVYPRVAQRWGAELIPFLLEGVAGVPLLNQADRIHPTAEGHRVIAQVAWPYLRQALEGIAR